jgi:predicted Zn-dependent protease
MKKTVFILFVVCFTFSFYGQKATLTEEVMSLETYGFGKPNPVPMLADNPKIFPYFKFEEYEQKVQKKDWKVITLENDYIQVFVLPEIGGKVWGAIEKSTGNEFLYKNKVVKFRNIAMRGPWTSGGIEMNFGIIGHHPGTATSVDYMTRENNDGSVSCFVSNTDLPSNTRWNVEIRLEKDKAYFETNVSWYNASPINESYYNWMTAAAVVSNDLEFFIPGNAYVEHDGSAHSWPVDDKGRDLSFYRNNNFGPDKSYHIVGEYNDFFGGYYHDRNFGFGQWSPYEEMPGQKLWLWSQARSGGIWEDLLTDTDGQYTEFQAGRLLDQYFPGKVNPISQVGFDPYVMDKWSEIWFPFKDIGGMVDASKHGALNVEIKEEGLYVGLNAFQKLDQELKVLVNGKAVFSQTLNLRPMEIFSKTIPISASDKFQIVVKGTELDFTNRPERNQLKRPFHSDVNLTVSKAETHFQEALEAIEFREYQKAHDVLAKLIKLDASHRAGHVKLAELEYRRTNFEKAISLANTVLKMDTYDAGANYIIGLGYRETGDTINALESFGWAARDIKYRSVSFAQMAELYLASDNYERAEIYAKKALDFNTYNLNARKVLAVVARKQGDLSDFQQIIDEILAIDALNFFAATEKKFLDTDGQLSDIKNLIKNEFPAETLLDLALQYTSLGLYEEAIAVLGNDPSHPKNKLWLAYLLKDSNTARSATILIEASTASSDFVFPFRRESVPVMKWATEQQPANWKLSYYLAQNKMAVGLQEEGMSILKDLTNRPDSDTFYRFRAEMLKEKDVVGSTNDYARALDLNDKDWKVWEENIRFSLENENYGKGLELSNKAYRKYPNNYNIGLVHAQALGEMGKNRDVLKVLKNIQVLPFEHASKSRRMYESAHIDVAKDLMEKKEFKEAVQILNQAMEWPENLGVGKPYDPDERLQQYFLALGSSALGNKQKEEEILNQIVQFTMDKEGESHVNNIFGLLSLQKQGKDEELKTMLSKLRAATQETDLKNRLALALFKNDKNELQMLREKNIVSNVTWEALIFAIQ